jgi:hypothetical protein
VTIASIKQEQLPLMSPHPPKGRFSVYITANVQNFCISVLIGLWFTSDLIHHLVGALSRAYLYGIVNKRRMCYRTWWLHVWSFVNDR